MIKVTVQGEDVVGRMRDRENRIKDALTNKVNALAVMLQAKILGKLEGEVLQSHTHHLAESVRVGEPAHQEGSSIVARVQAGGPIAPYARPLEYGTTSSYDIPKVPFIGKHALAFMIDGKTIIRKKVTHPPIKEYAFMRGTLDEMKEFIASEIQKTISETMRS